MKKSGLFFILLVGTLGMFPPFLHSQETITSEMKKRVKSVDIRGNVSVPEAVILPLIHTKPGDYFNEASVKKDVQRVSGLGEFESVEFKKVNVSGGVNLVFLVKEVNKIIRAIRIQGNVNARRNEVRACLRLRIGDKYNYNLAREDVLRIYSLKKFGDVEMLKKDIPGGIEITYVLTELQTKTGFPSGERSGSVKFRALPSKSGVPYIRSNTIPGLTDKEGKHLRDKVPGYYKREMFTGPNQGPLMLNFGASHNFLGSK